MLCGKNLRRLKYTVWEPGVDGLCVCVCVSAYTSFYIIGLILSMQIPFVGFQPIRTSEHMAAAGTVSLCFSLSVHFAGFHCVRTGGQVAAIFTVFLPLSLSAVSYTHLTLPTTTYV